jgi:hypothetical protein
MHFANSISKFAVCRLHGSFPETTFEEGIEANRRGTWTISAVTGEVDFTEEVPISSDLADGRA